MNPQERHYYVYMVASRSHVLYCGVTNNLPRRIQDHRNASFNGFTAQYKCTRLVWFECFQYVDNAIDREKQIKRWRREKKLALIKQMNPMWLDLSEVWEVKTAGPSAALRSGRDDNSVSETKFT
jgi:putative endonuclease